MMAGGPVKAALRLANHAAWWLRYRMHGQTRATQQEPARRAAQAKRSGE
jgi:hypothetical protein